MRVLAALLLLVLGIISAQAQDSTVVLSTRMFSSQQQINLSTLDGWRYKSGRNLAWGKPNVQTADWKRLKPSELSLREANSNGRVAGWFRIRLKPDSTFKGLQLAFKKGSRVAMDLYVDGHWLASYGNTGRNGKPYAEDKNLRLQTVLVPFAPEQEYLVALYVVDEVSPFTSTKLKSEFLGSNAELLSLVGPQAINSAAVNATLQPIFSTIWLVVPLLLTLLFGLLSFLNIYEKPLIRVLALWSTVLTLANLTYFSQLFSISFSVIQINYYVGNALLFGSIPLLVIALIRILNYTSYLRLGWFLIAMMFIAIVWDFSVEAGRAVVIATALQALFFLYILVVSWRNLMGAQWAIVMGTLFTIVFFLLYFFIFSVAPNFFNFYLISTGMILSLPISLLVYIFLRFKEIVADVREKAAAVLQITEEKQELLVTQNERLEQQVEARTFQLNQSLTDLRATQAQLIQKEKLASLGELTAGIAHEIQNPLNFVNNFSEVSAELIEELKEEAQAGHTEDVLAIADNLTSNLQKINHHGGRASSIVRSMLEHSRTDSGEKRPTDLNALADEYLKIAYHGLRAKENGFTCELITHFDPGLEPVEVAPQEIGRVLLNLYNNAFYAVSQRDRQGSDVDYQPTVEVNTQWQVSQVIIRVKDNGAGIPESVKTKIFQPFFTTKPTGEGTGLGLSLSYDIITKGYGGTLTVASKQGEGAELTISLPIDNIN